MTRSPLPKALGWPLGLYLVWWTALFAVMALRLELISPLVEYRKMVYLVGLAIWHVIVLIVVMNGQARMYLEACLRRQPPLPFAGIMFGLAVADLGLLYVLTK